MFGTKIKKIPLGQPALNRGRVGAAKKIHPIYWSQLGTHDEALVGRSFT